MRNERSPVTVVRLKRGPARNKANMGAQGRYAGSAGASLAAWTARDRIAWGTAHGQTISRRDVDVRGHRACRSSAQSRRRRVADYPTDSELGSRFGEPGQGSRRKDFTSRLFHK